MVGILSYGAYVPMWRIERDIIAEASGSGSMGGERTVASWDEDSITMGVEAGLDCLSGFDPKDIDGLYFATMSSPFKEKQASSIIASALDLRKDVYTGDFTKSSRAGILAIKAAVDAIKSGSAKKFLVITSDCRRAMPKSDFEQIFGDGSAALLIGEGRSIADIKGFTSISNAIPGPWQRSEDKYLKMFEPKMDRLFGLLEDVPVAVKKLMKNFNLKTGNISKFVLYGPDPRSYRDLAKILSIEAKSQLQDPLFEKVGITGTTHCLLLLVSALENAKPNEKIVCASYGEGSDAFIVITNENLKSIKDKHRGTKYVSSKRIIPSYGHFLDFQGTRDTNWPSEDLKASVVKYWRDEKWELPLYGMRCNKCKTLQYPIARCCMMCGEKDNHEEVKITNRGKIFTYTFDYILGPGLVPGDGINPAIRVVADMEDGCRLWLEMCDSELEEVEIDMPIETTFRLIHQKGGYRFYSWRARPIRG